MFNIIGQLREFAAAKGWHFIYGNDQYANFEADQNVYEAGDLVLIADLNAAPSYGTGGGLNGAIFAGAVMLGRKREDETYSSLDETAIQKYDSRLKDLIQLLATSLGEFSCTYRYDITQANFRVDINRFDANIDFIAGTITLSNV